MSERGGVPAPGSRGATHGRPPASPALILATALAIGLALVPASGRAQDTHYWNSQYGPHAMLLGGTIIGSVNDMSATYYNPGALGYIEKPQLLVSANVFQKSALTLEDGAGNGEDLVSSTFRPIPNMVAGAFNWPKLGRNRIAYSILSRHQFHADIRAAEIGKKDVLPDPDVGDEDFAGGFEFVTDVNETWLGVSWAPRVDNRVGFGVTSYLTIRSQSLERRVFAQAIGTEQRISMYQRVGSYDMNHYGLLFKAGMGFDLRPVTLGITLTTPTLRLGGSGDAIKNLTAVQLDPEDTGTRTDAFESAAQHDVTANYHTPLSVGIGAAYNFGETRLHFSAEWFSAVDPFPVLELTPFVSQATGEVVEPALTGASEEVLNWGLGLAHRFGERTKGYLSFITDNSARSPESAVAVTGFDVYHVGGGGAFAIGRTQLSAGIAYAWGGNEIDRELNLDPDEGESILDDGLQTELRYQRFTFMLGLGVQF